MKLLAREEPLYALAREDRILKVPLGAWQWPFVVGRGAGRWCTGIDRNEVGAAFRTERMRSKLGEDPARDHALNRIATGPSRDELPSKHDEFDRCEIEGRVSMVGRRDSRSMAPRHGTALNADIDPPRNRGV
jgi:hypothetical protein